MHTHVPARARAGSAGSMQRTHACTSMLYRPATPHQPPVLRTVPRSSSGSLPAGAAAAGTCAAAASDNTAHLLSQHRVLMETKGFTHDQASLILQVAQHRTAAATTGGTPIAAAPAAEPGVAGTAPSTLEAQAQPAAATAIGDPTAAAGTTLASMLEDRITFLEMELLKHALSTPSYQQQQLLLQQTPPAAAAAAAEQQRWNADGSLLRQQGPPSRQAASMLGAFPGLPDASAAGLFTLSGQLHGSSGVLPGAGMAAVAAAAAGDPTSQAVAAAAAAAAALAQLDPEVRAIAEVLSVRRGFGSLQDAAAAAAQADAQAHAAAAAAAVMAAGRKRPVSVWGRPGTAWQSMPLSARTAIVNGTDFNSPIGEPLLAPGDLADDVPYQPSSWAVVGTIACVYLGVVATFLLMCVGDVVGNVPY